MELVREECEVDGGSKGGIGGGRMCEVFDGCKHGGVMASGEKAWRFHFLDDNLNVSFLISFLLPIHSDMWYLLK